MTSAQPQKTRMDLVSEGYRFSSRGPCSGPNCKKQMEWWLSPNQRPCPFDEMPNDHSPAISHFATCVDGAEFKRRKGRAAQMKYLHTNQGK